VEEQPYLNDAEVEMALWMALLMIWEVIPASHLWTMQRAELRFPVLPGGR